MSDVSTLYMQNSLGLRKGAWTEEEDTLLRKCIERFGEGKWHQIPFRAGLNRCRKSCRLRWLNYLKPNIKRGKFTVDEVDMIVRLHKLLGNRWSLIAGRLPGRTANDVKNYWNTHLQKKHPNPLPQKQNQILKKTVVIKPRPRTFSKNITWFRGNTAILDETQGAAGDNSVQSPAPENERKWWESLLFEEESDKRDGSSINESDLDFDLGQPFSNFWDEEIAVATAGAVTAAGEDSPTMAGVNNLMEESLSCWRDLAFDVDFLNIFSTEQNVIMYRK